jgi:hypothetical protein
VTNEIYNYGYRTPRFPVDFTLILQTDERLPRLLQGRCLDISEDGLAVEVHEPLELGAKLTLILTLPGTASSVKIAAKVSNCHQDGYGVAFIFSSQIERRYIGDYLASLR